MLVLIKVDDDDVDRVTFYAWPQAEHDTLMFLVNKGMSQCN